MKNSMALAGAALGLGLLVAPSVARADAPQGVSVRQVVSGGSGCASGHAQAALAGDGQFLLVADGKLEAKAGPGVSLTEGRKFCQLLIDIDVPAGWSYSVSSLNGYSGYFNLDDDVTAVLSISRYFTGDQPDEPAFEETFRGPVGGRFFRPETSANAGPWSPCGEDRALNIHTSVRVSKLGNPNGSGRISVSPPWGIQVFKLNWRRCQ